MSCNHFLVEGHSICAGVPTEEMMVACTECGLCGYSYNLQSEIAAAKAEDRFVDANHPDYWLMVADAKAAVERATVRSKRWSGKRHLHADHRAAVGADPGSRVEDGRHRGEARPVGSLQGMAQAPDGMGRLTP